MGETEEVTVAGRRIAVPRPEKPLYPADGWTKQHVVDYVRAVASSMVPHIRGRPLTMRRFPDGIDADGFFQKEAPEYLPDWVRTGRVPQRSGGVVRHVLVEDATTLVYLATQACLEFHVPLSTMDDLERPDRIVVDVDPPEGTGGDEVRSVVHLIGELYETAGLTPYLLATGGRGFHVVAPLDGSVSFEVTRAASRELADRAVATEPGHLTTAQHRDQRGGRIFLDTGRNAYGQTVIAPYSPRARPGAPVATPLNYAELDHTDPARRGFEAVRKRLSAKEDPWLGMHHHAVGIKTLERTLRD